MLQAPNDLHDPLQDLLRYVHVSFLLRSSDLDWALQMWPHWYWVKGKNHLPQPPGNVLPSGAWEVVGRLCCNGAVLADVQFLLHQDPQVLLCKTAFQLFNPSLYSCMDLSLLKCRASHFPSLNFLRLLLAHFSSLSRFLWTAEQPSGLSTTATRFVSPANLLRAHSVQTSRSLMMMLNSIDASTNPGTHSGDWSPTTLCTIDHNLLSPAVQPVFSSPNCPFIWANSILDALS